LKYLVKINKKRLIKSNILYKSLNTKTRSETNYENAAIYEVNIDFDAASQAWKYNKKLIGNGSYRYLCCKIKKTCNLTCVPGENYCNWHLKLFYEGKI
jgi:hypothetical protein